MLYAAIGDTPYNIMLLLHVLTAFAAFAPVFVHPILTAQSRSLDAENRGRLLTAVAGNGRKIYAPALLVTGILGFGVAGMSKIPGTDELAWKMSQGWLTFEDPLRWGEFARRVGLYLVGGLLIGLFEEWFFRGWLVRRATADLGPRMGTLLAAGIFGLVHAFRPSTLDHAITHDAAGAWHALRSWTALMVDPTVFGPAAFGLLCFALLLSAAYRRTGTLWTAIGIHAGAVLVLFSYGALTTRIPGPEWSGTRLPDGPARALDEIRKREMRAVHCTEVVHLHHLSNRTDVAELPERLDHADAGVVYQYIEASEVRHGPFDEPAAIRCHAYVAATTPCPR